MSIAKVLLKLLGNLELLQQQDIQLHQFIHEM